MRATTSGVIHKREVIIGNRLVKEFLDNQKNNFLKFCQQSNVVYDENTILSDNTLNYLNILPNNKVEESLKNILLKEYYECERMYPFLGDYLLHKMFDTSSVRQSKKFVFEKRHENKFLTSLKNSATSEIAKWFFSNTNLNRSINIEKYHGRDITVESLEEFMFDMDYDFAFYSSKNPGDVKSYKFALINGIIESVGEIHHLLYKANETKQPFVIFCFGMSEEVKQTILNNNSAGKFKVYPVCLNVNDENSLNILNDMAAIHDSDVISSDLGQSISQEVRKELPTGHKICFYNGKISITPVASSKKIESHRRFLKSRIREAETKIDVRVDVLKNRLKMFTGKRINIFIPERLLQHKSQSREIDYLFRFIGKLSHPLTIVTLNGRKFYIPNAFIKIAQDKQKSLNLKFSQIEAIVYWGIMFGQRHLVECHCILPIYKSKQPPLYHKFAVYSLFDKKTGKVVPKYVNCNNCGVTHFVEELCKSTIKIGKEDIRSVRQIEEVCLNIPEKIIKILKDYNATIDIYEEIEDIFENDNYPSNTVIKREIIDENYHIKILQIQSNTKIKILSEKIDDIIVGE